MPSKKFVASAKQPFLRGFYGKVLKPVMKGLDCGDDPRVVP